MNIKEKGIIFCSIVRNAEAGLRRNIPVLNEIVRHFRDWKIVVFENDSVDATKQLLADWQKSYPDRVFVVSEDRAAAPTIPKAKEVSANQFFCRPRIEKMAGLRNQYIDYICRKDWKSDFLCVVDLDVARIFADGFLTSFTRDDWDAVTAFGYSTSPRFKLRYHDTYAHIAWGQEHTPQTEGVIVANADSLGRLKPNDNWVRVYSAFGGLAIYKWGSVCGLRYEVDANDDSRVEVRSEHVSLYRQMVARGHDKFFINPAMRIHYQRITSKIIIAALGRLWARVIG